MDADDSAGPGHESQHAPERAVRTDVVTEERLVGLEDEGAVSIVKAERHGPS